MDQATKAAVLVVIDIIRAVYKNQADELSKKLENISYINIDNLVNKVQQEIPPEEIPHSYNKIVKIIESIIQD